MKFQEILGNRKARFPKENLKEMWWPGGTGLPGPFLGNKNKLKEMQGKHWEAGRLGGWEAGGWLGEPGVATLLTLHIY